MKYYILPQDRWDELRPLVECYGPLPPPETTSAAVAEDASGYIVGVLFMQLAMHMEPLVLADPHVSFLRLAEVLTDRLRDTPDLAYYVFVPDGKVAGMAARAGFHKLPYEVWSNRPIPSPDHDPIAVSSEEAD